ncbi:hypothetical protein Pan14r_53620 [Crateriforma conspicua]|uniref:Uncharacterized protein n=2 Tax=Crateriforma conspicua TaxID=2527996 RepID=A0A5C5XW14_9PLAN|nr:hypothetical protein Pan14r_53620 [Crateriforma conspicua]
MASAGLVAQGQVVQLPTFRTFSYSGSVLVPDGGTAVLGGNSSTFRSRSPRGNGQSSARSFGGGSVTATVIDSDAMDRQIRGLDTTARRTDATPSDRIGRIEEGKSLVRFARKMASVGKLSQARMAYKMAIDKLDGRLAALAAAESRRLLRP